MARGEEVQGPRMGMNLGRLDRGAQPGTCGLSLPWSPLSSEGQTFIVAMAKKHEELLHLLHKKRN